MNFSIIRFLKSAFIRLRLHVLFSWAVGLGQQAVWMTKLSKWAADNKNVPLNDFPSRWDYNKRYHLYQHICKTELLHLDINYLEFGVADGHSFNWWMTENDHPGSRFYGFDTFTGLPEDFGPYKKGTFANSDHMPVPKDGRGQFLPGLFQQTLPPFLKNLDNSRKNVIMLDADLFTATLFVLTSLAPFLKKDDIIFFDEFVVPTHEFMAFDQFTKSFYFDMELLGAANNYYFVAFKVK